MTKISYAQALETVLTNSEMTNEVREKLEALKAQLEKRATAKSGKPTKAQREVAEFTEAVYNVLSDIPARCGDIANTMGVSGQRVSAALSKLVKAGRVVKTVGEKRVALFAIANSDE